MLNDMGSDTKARIVFWPKRGLGVKPPQELIVNGNSGDEKYLIASSLLEKRSGSSASRNGSSAAGNWTFDQSAYPISRD